MTNFRRIVALLLLLMLLPTLGLAEGETIPGASQPALYKGQLRVGAPLLTQPDSAAEMIAYIGENKYLEILEVLPAFLKVRYKGEQVGWIKRSAMSDTSVTVVDPKNTPLYSTVPCQWLAWVKDQAPVLSLPDPDSEALITLGEGTRVAVIDIENGWARMIYHRQYAYIDTNHFSELMPLNLEARAGEEAPIAAYTSFYRITTDESNQNRMVNIQVACDRFGLYVLQPGEKLDFNQMIGPYSRKIGYKPANVLIDGQVVQGYGGGTCQVSSTLYNAILQTPLMSILHRRAHGPGAASYLPHGADAAVGSKTQNFIVVNRYPFPVRIDGTAKDGALTIAIYRANDGATAKAD